MTLGGDGIIGWRRSKLLLPAVVACLMFAGSPIRAQLFSDRPPPVPPASVPDPGGAVSLAPPSGPASLPPTLTQPVSPVIPPTVTTVPPAAPLNAAVPGQAVLSLTARYGKDSGPITS